MAFAEKICVDQLNLRETNLYLTTILITNRIIIFI